MSSPRVAILGAGLSGLVCAQQLKQKGYSVQIFESTFYISGRLDVFEQASYTAMFYPPAFTVKDYLPTWYSDHGAQYFTARSDEFRQQVQAWIDQGLVAEWTGKFVTLSAGVYGPDPGFGDPRYVGVPGMDVLCSHLSEGQQILSNRCGTKLTRLGEKWELETLAIYPFGNAKLPPENQTSETFTDTFDAVVCAFPAPKVLEILPHDISFRQDLEQVSLGPCWCVMASFVEPIDVDFSAAFVNNSPLRWIAREQTKPGKELPYAEHWVLHATTEWSREYEFPGDTDTHVEQVLLQALSECLKLSLPQPASLCQHFWKHAIPENPLNQGCLIDQDKKLIACGDWSSQARVEGAYLSGLSAAQAVESCLPKSQDIIPPLQHS